MLYRKIIAVCSKTHTKHINKLCGQNVELLNVKLVVHIVTIGLKKGEEYYGFSLCRQGNETVLPYELLCSSLQIKACFVADLFLNPSYEVLNTTRSGLIEGRLTAEENSM